MSDDIEKTLKSKNQSREGYKDPSNNFPSVGYGNSSSLNKAARGVHTNELYIGGGTTDLNLDLKENDHSEYPLNQVKESISGHISEIDDTPNNERLLWRHKTGSGVEMRPDGTIIVSSRKNTIHITGGDQKVIIEGDGDVHYMGNLKLHVSGDLDMEVGGDYNLRVQGDKNEEIHGGSNTKVYENKLETVSGNSSTFVTGSNTETYLSDYNKIVKGNNTDRVAGKHAHYIGDDAIMTAKNAMNFTSPDINIAANDLTAIATTGAIGGDNVIHYGKNYYGTSATFTEGVTGPVFHGDLQGTAVRSITSDVTNSQNYSDPDTHDGSAGNTGSAQGYTADNTPTDTGNRMTPPGPSSTTMDQYLNQSDKGVRTVTIDPGDVMKNTIDKTSHYGGISKYPLTTEMVRSRLRDPNTARNKTFIGRAIAENVLSASYIQQKPEKFEIGLIFNRDGTGKIPAGKLLGNEDMKLEKIATEANTIVVRTLIPNQAYNPELQYQKYKVINGHTKLAAGISLAKFLGGYGDPNTLEHITDDVERVKIARNLYAHAEFMNSAQQYLEELNSHRLIVTEGLYKKRPDETLDPNSLNLLASRGQVVVYELRDRNGLIDIEKTFDLALYCKDYVNFDRMILDYDSYNPDDSLNAQIIIQMPAVNADWNMRYRNEIETRFNNYTQTNGELVEISEPSA